jgi:integrase
MTKMTQTTVGALLKRGPNGGFIKPSVTLDHEVGGLRLVVGARQATWTVDYKPHGTREDGRRHAKVRMTLGDAMTMPLPDARTAARAVKLEVAQGGNPHAEKRNARAQAIAERAVKPMTLGLAVNAYERDMLKRRSPSEASRRQAIHYAKKAVTLLGVGELAVDRLHLAAIRTLIRTMDGSAAEVRHVYGALSRFCGFMLEEGMIEANPCNALPRRHRPKPGKARDYVPSLEELRKVWKAVEGEPMRDLAHFLLLTPLRLNEAASLVWGEIDFDHGWIKIPAERMKNRQEHQLPLSKQALAILVARRPAHAKPDVLVFPSGEGKPFDGWNRLLTRVRAAIGQGDAPHDARFAIHDCRRSFVSHLAGKFDVDALDQVLAHRRAGVTGVYQKSLRMPERAKALNLWADLLLGDAVPDNILPFARRDDV